jgi:hypothetical protein
MDHSQALSSHASERYLLGDMSEPERFDFEAHYFDCGECAADVRAGDAFARAVRAVSAQPVSADHVAHARQPLVMRDHRESGSRRFAWLTPAALLPMAASVMLAALVGYQSLVTIPGLRSSRALSQIVLRAAARGDEQTIALQRDQPYTVLSLDVNAADPGTPLVYEVSPLNGAVRTKGAAKAPPPGLPLLVLIPNPDLDRAGPWTMVLRTPQGTEISRYPFSLKLN